MYFAAIFLEEEMMLSLELSDIFTFQNRHSPFFVCSSWYCVWQDQTDALHAITGIVHEISELY